ncbi:MAG: sodium/solute symporter [FCB group bacterium]|nr:sodium/solute symporter [FCB group bacterium]
MPAFTINLIDLSIVGVYVVFIVALGLHFAKKHESAEEYFLGGRKFTWPLIGLSLYASNMSSSSLVGLAGSAYGTGISVYNYEWMAAIILIFFAIFFLPYFLRSQVYTMPEFLEKRYDSRARYYFSALNILMTIVIDTAGTLYAGALIINLIFPAIPLWQTMLALALVAGAYTIAGGLSAVVYTDAIQAVLLTVGAIIIAIVAFVKVGSWSAVTAVTPPEMLKVFMPLDDSFLPWLGVLTGVPILGFYFWCTNQFMVQRVLGAKSIEHGRWGALFAGLLKLPVIFIMVLPGTMARVLYPDLPRADLAFPSLMFGLLPVGVRGFIMAGLLAAIMSSIDSTLNSASTLITMDFFKKLRPKTSSEGLMWAGRIFTFVFMALAAAWAPQILKFPSLFQYLQTVLAYASPPIVALFLVGLFWKRANAQGAFAGIVVGFIFGLGQFTVRIIAPETAWLPDIHFLYMALILLIITVLTIVIASLLTPAPDNEKVKAYIWKRADYDAETRELALLPWYKNFRIQAVVLFILTVLFVGMFA